MKYYFLSGFFHVSLLLFLSWHPALELEKKSRIVIEIVSLTSDKESDSPRTAPLFSDPQKKTVKLKGPSFGFNRDRSDRNADSDGKHQELPASIPADEQRLSQGQAMEVREKTDQFDRNGQGEGKSGHLEADYIRQLQSYIEQNKFYPRRALRLNQAGVVKIRLEIAPDGVFRDIRLVQTCAYESLNRAALKLIKDLKRFKPLPENFKEEADYFIIPISYEITGI